MRAVVRLVGIVCLVGGCELAAGLDAFTRADDDGAGGQGGGLGAGGTGLGGAAEGGGGSGPVCGVDLVIREVRTRGSNGATDDFVEIYNPTPSPVSLDPYRLSARSPGGGEDERWDGAGFGTIPAFGFLLIAGMGFNDPGLAPDLLLPQNRSFGDETLIYLKKAGSVIDIVCLCAMSCAASGWGDCGGVLLANPAATTGDQDRSVERSDPCVDTNSIADFSEGPSTPMGLQSPPEPHP